ncbi:MAG: DUF3006 domain-containing protein [Clostridia bacterium]|nr:DUF3006 domain-containing protein [Clostridia bacterium]
MKYTVDRITDGVAVLEKEDMSHVEVSVKLLPYNIKEGSILVFDGSSYTVDHTLEAERRRMLLQKQEDLLKKSKKQ